MKKDYPHYTAERVFFFCWKVVNEKGQAIRYGWQQECEFMADLLNTVFELGYSAGRRDEYQEAMKAMSNMN